MGGENFCICIEMIELISVAWRSGGIGEGEQHDWWQHRNRKECALLFTCKRGRCKLASGSRRVIYVWLFVTEKMPSNSITVLSLRYFHLSHASRYQLYKHPSTRSTNSHSNKSLISCPDKLPQNGIAASHSAAIRIIIRPPDMT